MVEKKQLDLLITFKQLTVKDFKSNKKNLSLSQTFFMVNDLEESQSFLNNYTNLMRAVFCLLKTWSQYILTSTLFLRNVIDKKCKKKRQLYNIIAYYIYTSSSIGNTFVNMK